MKMKHVVSAAFGAFALGLAATAVQAAPLAGPGSAVDANAAESGMIERVHWYGHRRYGWHYGYRPYGYYGYYKPYGYYSDYRPYRWHRWHYGHRHYHW
jgi:hypothetical protein